jgi:hypothetical protein
MASGSLEWTDALVAAGGLVKFYQGLRAGEPEIIDSCLQGIINVMIDRREYCNNFLESNIPDTFIEVAHSINCQRVIQ